MSGVKMKLTPKGRTVAALFDEHAEKLGINPEGIWQEDRIEDMRKVMFSLKADPMYLKLKNPNGIPGTDPGGDT